MPTPQLRVASAAISGANQFTSQIYFESQTYFLISIEGTFVGTVSLQRSLNGGTTWYTVQTWTAPAEQVCLAVDSSVYWRIGIATGNYTSGTANVQLSQ